MPRHPNFNERNMYDKPQVVADRPRLSPEFAAGVEENWRQEIETLMGVDEGVAQIVEALRRNGELENTLIVYMSDNGFMHGEHRALAEKVLPYEESIRIPLVMRGPGVPHARVDQRLVGNLDVTSTILDATDVAPGPRAGRALAARAARRPGRRVGPRHPDRERQRRERRADLPRHPHLPLPLRRAPHHRRVRALRPGEGPVPAPERRRPRALREGAARPRVAAARADRAAWASTAWRGRTSRS